MTQARNEIAGFFQDYGAKRFTSDKDAVLDMLTLQKIDIQETEKEMSELHYCISHIAPNAAYYDAGGYIKGHSAERSTFHLSVKLVRLARKLQTLQSTYQKMIDQNKRNFRKWNLAA